MVFKIQEKDKRFNFVTLLYDKQLQLLHKTRQGIDYDDKNDIYGDFQLDNEGNLVFTRSIKINNWDFRWQYYYVSIRILKSFVCLIQIY